MEEKRQEGMEMAEPSRSEDKLGVTGKRWGVRGIYGSKDVPILMLDGLIIGIFATIILLTVAFALNGGYTVTFQTGGGSVVESQKIRYGELVVKPEEPMMPGYQFERWETVDVSETAEVWSFEEDKVEGELTLYAVWSPKEITVKYDMDGGYFGGENYLGDGQVTFGGTYGVLPVPSKEGYIFDGWEYSGAIISADTVVSTSGEHVLKARWIAEEG